MIEGNGILIGNVWEFLWCDCFVMGGLLDWV